MRKRYKSELAVGTGDIRRLGQQRTAPFRRSLQRETEYLLPEVGGVLQVAYGESDMGDGLDT
ncbi:hypothetical protein GCM10025871_32020 [Deinococcus metallilatus]|nr:hypothetical protein GCM10025871_32020 [Deinococcus metallilatus]